MQDSGRITSTTHNSACRSDIDKIQHHVIWVRLLKSTISNNAQPNRRLWPVIRSWCGITPISACIYDINDNSRDITPMFSGSNISMELIGSGKSKIPFYISSTTLVVCSFEFSSCNIWYPTFGLVQQYWKERHWKAWPKKHRRRHWNFVAYLYRSCDLLSWSLETAIFNFATFGFNSFGIASGIS